MRLLRSLSASHRRLLEWLVPVFGLLGFCAGYYLGWALSIHSAKNNLQNYAERLMERSDAASMEGRTVLATMQINRLPYCSHAELDRYGMLLFRSRYLRDLGHLRDGYIECSSILGPLSPPVQTTVPALSQVDGTQVYPAIPLFQLSASTAVTLQQGDRYVTFSPNLMASLELPVYSYVFTVHQSSGGPPAKLMGASPSVPQEVLSSEGQGRFQQILFATRCSAQFFDCVTAYVAIPLVLRSQRRFSVESGIAGGFAGISLAFLLTLILERRQGIEAQFALALRRHQLTVAYQPIVDLRTGRTVGAEGLARWMDKDGRVIEPNVFLPLADRLGLTEELTRQVVCTVLDDLLAMPVREPDFRISFNVSAPDVTAPWFLDFLQTQTRQSGVLPKHLAIEITESATANHDQLAHAIRALRQSGFCVYLDDFGTGYSSLAYLEFLAVDFVKIDKVFTRAIQTASVTSTILPQIVEMAARLHLQVIVEGVESEQQASCLAESRHALFAQGWHFGHPMPAAALIDRLLAEVCPADSI